MLGPCHFYPLLCPLLHEIFPWYLQFSWRDCWSFIFYCFPLFLCIVHLRRLSYLIFGTLHSVGCIFPFLLCLLLIFSVVCKASLDNHFVLFHFFFLGVVLITTQVQCYKLLFIVLHTLCLPDLIPWIYLSPPLYNHKGFDLGHIWMI